jgi:predicted RNA binding protein YcfA (HicA-like mRNA interferase family)
VKLPRDLSGQRVVQALKRLGFSEEKQEGSHIRLARGSVRLTVPAHRVLAPKTLQSILRQAQISVEELKAVL